MQPRGPPMPGKQQKPHHTHTLQLILPRLTMPIVHSEAPLLCIELNFHIEFTTHTSHSEVPLQSIKHNVDRFSYFRNSDLYAITCAPEDPQCTLNLIKHHPYHTTLQLLPQLTMHVKNMGAPSANHRTDSHIGFPTHKSHSEAPLLTKVSTSTRINSVILNSNLYAMKCTPEAPPPMHR